MACGYGLRMFFQMAMQIDTQTDETTGGHTGSIHVGVSCWKTIDRDYWRLQRGMWSLHSTFVSDIRHACSSCIQTRSRIGGSEFQQWALSFHAHGAAADQHWVTCQSVFDTIGAANMVGLRFL